MPLGVAELVRLGEDATPWVEEVAEGAVRVAKSARGRPEVGWEHAAALDAAAEVLARAGEDLGASDVARLAATLAPAAGLPDEVPAEPARRTAWVLRRVLRPTHGRCRPVARAAPVVARPQPRRLRRVGRRGPRLVRGSVARGATSAALGGPRGPHAPRPRPRPHVVDHGGDGRSTARPPTPAHLARSEPTVSA